MNVELFQISVSLLQEIFTAVDPIKLGCHLWQLGADYRTNFSPVGRAEISARLPKQIFLKDVYDYMKKVSTRAEI